MPTGKPEAVNPAGTEMAGFAMKVMYEQERIQSMYVDIARSGNLCRIRYVHVERRDLRHGKNEVVEPLEELPALLVHLCLSGKRAPDVRGGHPFGLRDFVFDRVLDPLGPLAHQRRIPWVIRREP